MEIPFAPGSGFGSGPVEATQRDQDIDEGVITQNYGSTARRIIEEEGSSESTPGVGSCGWKVRKLLKKRLPALTWLPKYRKGQLVGDVIAGIAVGLTVVPQSMAYAAIAGLTPEFGLYSSYVGCFLYVLFGSCRQVTIGPVAVLGLLSFETCGSDFPACVILTGFYSGVFELFMVVLHLGWVVNFISEPVVVGFTSAAAITIISSQIKSFLGLGGPKGSGFMGYWQSIIGNIGTIRVGDAVMGLCSFGMLVVLQELKDLKIPQNNGRGRKLLKSLCWFLSISRNVIIVVLTTLTAFLWPGPGIPPFQLTGAVRGGFPYIGPPDFRLPFNSSTSGDPDSLRNVLETLSFLGTGPLVVALIAVLQNVAISKAFGNGQRVDATQEMLALGMSNVVGSFFSAIPICGSFSRSAVNEASGVQSPLAGMFTGLLVLLSLGFLTPTFYYIPRASLAAVIISAVMSMIEFRAQSVMWKVNRLDFLTCLITFSSAILLGMEYGIIVGVGISLSFLLMKSLKPGLNPEVRTDPGTGINFVYARPDYGLTFPSVDYIRSSVARLARKFPEVSIIVINFEKWNTLDYTVVQALSSLAKGLVDKELIFVDVGPHWINAFKSTGLRWENIPHCCSFSELSDYLQNITVTQGATNSLGRRRNEASLRDKALITPTRSDNGTGDCDNDTSIPSVVLHVPTFDNVENNEESLNPLLHDNQRT